MSNESMASYVTDTPSDIAELLAEIKELEAKNAELEKKIKSFDAYVMRDEKLKIAVEIIKELQSMDNVPHLDHHFEFLAAINGDGV